MGLKLYTKVTSVRCPQGPQNLDLHKAYDALERSRCLDIQEGYVVGTRALRLLCRY